MYRFDSKDYLARIKLEEQMNLKLQLALASDNFDIIFSDLLFLSKQNELLRLINFNEKLYTTWISQEYLEMSRRKKIYDQIRYIDKTGMEIVRVNYNKGNPQIVKKSELQFKGNRYYFKDTFVLGRNEIFVSPLDLNIENGEIEKPLKPMVRFGMPVFDENNQKSGILLFNYLACSMLTSMKEAAKLSPGRVMLVNPNGFWLLSPDKEDEWGFMMKNGENKRFPEKFSREWEEIKASDNCQINTEKGLFTASTIYPLKQYTKNASSSSGSPLAFGESEDTITSGKYFWKIISHIPRDDLKTGTRRLFTKLMLMAVLMFAFSFIPAWIIAKAAARRKLHQIALYRSANYDNLTDLPNRSMFMDRLSQIVKQARRYQRKFALLFIDLDGFKSVNDTLGHDAGDELLIKVAQRLKKCVRESDTAARLGGDEFTVIFSTITTSKDAQLGAQKIIDKLSMPFKIKGHDVQISASIGVSLYPENGETVDLLLKNADTAMYQAKKAGKNTCRMSRSKT